MSKLEFDKLRVDMWISGTADNEGNGGYCSMLQSVLQGKVYTKTLGGYGLDTTVTRMTLKALVEGLKAVKKPSFLHIYTNIPQVSSGINKYMYQWSTKGWKKADGGDLQHVDLWMQVYDLLKEKSLGHTVKYQKASPNPDANLIVIHKSSEYAMRAKKSINEVSLP